MAIGHKTTNYDTFLTNLTHQKMSYAKFDSTYVKSYIANKTPFEAAMADVKANFGLTLPTDPDAASAGKLLLTDYEVENLRKAYERTLEVGAASQKEMSQQDYELYGTYIPFSMAICHTINHKSGMDHTTYAHTGAMVNIYALGVGAEKFRGVFDNTEIYHKLAELTGVQEASLFKRKACADAPGAGGCTGFLVFTGEWYIHCPASGRPASRSRRRSIRPSAAGRALQS